MLDPPSLALLESQCGPFASRILTALPSCHELTLDSPVFRALLLRRLRLPLPLDAAACRCRRPVDPLGDHRAACPRSGILRSRGLPLERAAARVCREAGATVACNVLVRDLNIHPDRLDDRRIEVIANGLPLWGGAQLAVDTTLVSPLDASGAARRHQRQYQGAALRLARRAKERTYPELMRSQRCRLVVLALEVGGRWSPEASQFVRLLARCRARAVPRPLRPATIAAFSSRWSALLAFSAARAFGASLLGLSLPGTARAWRTLTSQKTACSCSLHRDRRTPVAKRSVRKKKKSLPPEATRAFATAHDDAVLACLDTLLSVGAPSGLPLLATARAQLALRHGGLGLRSAAQHAPAAYWSSWADVLPVIASRDPAFARALVDTLEGGSPAPEVLQPLLLARASLTASGFAPPPWPELLTTPAPLPGDEDEEPQLDNTRGWQRPASKAVDEFCYRSILCELDSPAAALRDSQAGPFAARILTARPTSPELSLAPSHFRVLLLRRLRLPLPLTAAFCRCCRRQDEFGDHLAACPRSGVLRARGAPLERAAARVCRETGATVATNVLVRDLNVTPCRQDDRRIEVIANGLPLWGGVQVAVDTTLVSPLTAAGEPRRESRRTAGAALRHARRAKERTYPELCNSGRRRLVVLGIETGGRWSPEAVTFLRLIARSRARSAPPPLQSARISAYVLRWSALLAFAAARAFATSLLSLPLSGAANVDGDPPLLSDLLAEPSASPPFASRMP